MTQRRLSVADVVAIRKAVAADPKTSISDLSEKYGLNRYAIYSLVIGRTYKTVGGPTLPDLILRRAFSSEGRHSPFLVASRSGRVRNRAPRVVLGAPLAETW